MIRTARSIAAVVLLVGFALVGMPESAGATEAADDQSETVKLRAARILIDVPNTWVRIEPSKKDDLTNGAVQEFLRENPEWEDQLAAAQEASSGAIKFEALDSQRNQGTYNNVVVAVAQGLWPTTRRDVENMLSGEVPGDARVFGVHRAKVGTKEAWRTRLRFQLKTPSGPVSMYQAEVIVRGTGGELTDVVTTAVDDPSNREIADRIVRSVRPY